MFYFTCNHGLSVDNSQSKNFQLTVKKKEKKGDKKAVLSQGNRAMPQLFFSV